MPSSREYSGMARSHVDCLRQNLQSKGITVQGGDNATVEYEGVKLSINYDESKQALQIEILEKPAFIPESLIWGFVDSTVKQCT